MTLQARGYRSQTMIDFETAFKTAPTPTTGKIIPFTTNSIVATQKLNDSAIIRGTRNPASPLHGNKSVDGDLGAPLDFRAVGYLFKGLLGAPETKDNADGTYTHVFKVKDEPQPSMVIQKAYPDIQKYFIFGGCRIGTLKLPFGGDQEAALTATVMGSTFINSATTYDSAPQTVILDRAENFQAMIKENDEEIVSLIKSGDLTIDAGLDGDQYCVGDEGTRGDIPEGLMTITGSMSALFTDNRFVEKAAAGTVSSLELIYKKATKSLSFKFPEIVYELKSPTIDGPKGVLCDCNWKAFQENDTNKSAVIITLTNDVASY